MHELRVLILAAGKGARMKSKTVKVLHSAGGAPLIEHVLKAATALSPAVCIVTGHQSERVHTLIPKATFAEQREQLGTGHAVMAAAEHYKGYSGDLLVLPGDAALIQGSTLKSFVAFHHEGGYAASVLTAEIPDPTGYGRIVRRNDRVESIVEHRDATPEIRQIREINSSIYVFKGPALFEALARVRNENAQSEYYLTDVIGILVSQGQKVGAFKTPYPEEILGINTRQELAAIDRLMRRRKCEALMTAGVTIVDPETTYIDADVEIGSDTVIYPSVQIYGKTVIGSDTTIHSFCRISNSLIGEGSTILEGCIIVDSSVGEKVTAGPYAHIRMETRLEDSVKVGNFVEIKKSKLGAGTKSMHLTYLGDANIGKNVNVGAGTITCNYDGTHKHPTTIEDGAFIGSDTQLIAPVTIHTNAYVGTGTTVREDVPSGALAVSAGKQRNIEGWVEKRKQRK